MKITQTLAMAVLAVGMGLSTGSVLAQNNGGPGGARRGNWDPAQMQQHMMDRYREALEVKDDAEWNALQPLVQKVMDARMAERRDSFGAMGRMFGRRRGGSSDSAQGDQGSSRRGGFFGAPSPENEALQRAIDSKASKAEIKAALDKYVASRKAKEAELTQAQDNLRKVLTTRQEAIATLDGLL